VSFKIETTPRFEKDVKKLCKRFPKLKEDLTQLIVELKNNPTMGTHLGNNVYKIRLQNSSILSGKSGGFRVISYYFVEDTLYLVTMYSKNDRENILDNELKKIIQQEINEW
jgi:mRNA-degrading endonuclease RelE of RelBE toxin-antitoxin system